MVKQSVVVRQPIELTERINNYEKILKNSGLNMNKTNVMRLFASEAITPRDSVRTFIGVLNEASKKKK